jgi:hypothetical protein
MSDKDNMEQLAAIMGGHQITGEDGQPSDEQEQEPVTESAPEEPATEDTGNKDEVREEPAQVTDELVEDESGKKYVPQKRFDEVYAKLKQLERDQQVQKPVVPAQPTFPAEMSKADQIEAEMLYATMPEFDPGSDKYSEELDLLGSQVYLANPGITKLEAARRARSLASKLSQRREVTKQSVRDYKAQTTEGAFTSKPLSGRETQPDPNSMSLEEMENYLKAKGAW